jgi:hypothetical protein
MTIKTVEQARALPEIRGGLAYFSRERTLPNGDKVIEDLPRQLSAQPVEGDSIALFTDKDGRTMQVVHTVEEGWCKTEFRL